MSPDTSAAVRELEQIEQRLAASWVAGDCEGWAALVAPEWSVIHIDGAPLARAQVLAMCREPALRPAAMHSDEVTVRVFGDAAVVTGRTTATTAGDAPETVVLRFTDVFVRREAGWQVVASHATRVPDH